MMTTFPSLGATGVSEILFIDRGAPDFPALIAGARPGVRVHLLHSRGDAFTQIADALERKVFQAVHIVTHGAPGLLAFSSGAVARESLNDHASDLARIG